MAEGPRRSTCWASPGPYTPQHQFSLVGRGPCKGGLNVAQRVRGTLHKADGDAPDPISDPLATSNRKIAPARDPKNHCPVGAFDRLRIRAGVQPGVQAGIRTAARTMERSTVYVVMSERDGFELNRRDCSAHLAPLAGRGRIALAIRVRGTIRESGPVERPPHPDPLPASGAREK